MNDSRGYKRAEKSFSGWRYIGFSAADLSYGLLYFWIASFLSIYYTDVFGISASAVSIMLLVVRVYDAVIDPIIGSLMDNHRTKMGRFRPWVLVGGVLMAISVVMLFWAHPGWSEPAKIVYMYMTYIFNCTAMSIFYMAYGALGGTISANSMIRARANSCRFAFSGIANLGIGYFVPAMLAFFGAESMVRGYLYSVVICGAIAIPMVVVTTFSTKEVIQPDVEVKPPFKDQLRSFVTNKPMILLAFVFFLQGSSNTFRQTAATYYFTYVVGDLSYFSVYSMLQSLINILGAFTAPYLFRWVKEKHKALFWITAISAVCLLLMHFIDAPSPLFFILVAISGYSLGGIPTLSYAMLPDAVDYAQAKDGIRNDAFMAAVGSFTFQGGMAISGSVILMILNAVGYIANAEQSTRTLAAMSSMISVIPAILLGIISLLMVFYPLNERKHDEIVTELREKGLLE